MTVHRMIGCSRRSLSATAEKTGSGKILVLKWPQVAIYDGLQVFLLVGVAEILKFCCLLIVLELFKRPVASFYLAIWSNGGGPFHGTVPREDHLIPLMVVAGAAGNDKGRPVFVDHVMKVPMASYEFGRE